MSPDLRAHDQAFKRGQAHGSVYAQAPLHGCCTRAIAQMERDEIRTLGRFAQIPGRLSRDVEVGGTVKPVPADVMFGIPIVRHGVMKGVGRQGLVKRRVEDRHLRDTREPGPGGFYAEKIGRVVERGQRYESADRRNHLIVDQGRLPEEFPAVDHTMADAEKLGLVLNDPVFTVHLLP